MVQVGNGEPVRLATALHCGVGALINRERDDPDLARGPSDALQPFMELIKDRQADVAAGVGQWMKPYPPFCYLTDKDDFEERQMRRFVRTMTVAMAALAVLIAWGAWRLGIIGWIIGFGQWLVGLFPL